MITLTMHYQNDFTGEDISVTRKIDSYLFDDVAESIRLSCMAFGFTEGTVRECLGGVSEFEEMLLAEQMNDVFGEDIVPSVHEPKTT